MKDKISSLYQRHTQSNYYIDYEKEQQSFTNKNNELVPITWSINIKRARISFNFFSKATGSLARTMLLQYAKPPRQRKKNKTHGQGFRLLSQDKTSESDVIPQLQGRRNVTKINAFQLTRPVRLPDHHPACMAGRACLSGDPATSPASLSLKNPARKM